MSVKIVVESTTDLIPAVKERLTVVPLTIRFGETDYIDGVTITHKEFYEKLVESDVLPTTSQATPDSFDRIFRQAKADGDEVVVLTIASKLSGTYQSARIAAEDYPGMVFVVDSQTVAIGAGILAELALRLLDEGMSAADIALRLVAEREKVRVIAMLDTLEYLRKGGRISKTAAVAGGLLSIKPVVTIKEGEILVLGKARGSKQANNLLVKEIQSAGGVDFDKPVLLGYTGLTDVLLQKYIEDSAFLWEGLTEELHTTIIGSTVGTHAGPGAVAAAFFSKEG